MKGEIKDALSKITPGEWMVLRLSDAAEVRSFPGRIVTDVTAYADSGLDQCYADADFIAKAPEYLRWCLSEIERLEAILSEEVSDEQG